MTTQHDVQREKLGFAIPAGLEVQPELLTLSTNAARLFVSIWLRLATRGTVSFLWFRDNEISKRARIPLFALQAAQSECCRRGLLWIEPGLSQSRYELGEAAIPMPESTSALQ